MRSTLILVLAACGEPRNAIPDAATPDAKMDAAVSDTPVVTREGLVFIMEYSDATSSGASANPVFVNGAVWGQTLGIDGPCTAYQDAPGSGMSAGSIAVTNTTVPLTLEPSGTSPNVTYSPTPSAPSNLFASGASIAVDAAGADFPSFSTTVVAPEKLVGFSPPTTISRSAGVEVTWTAGDGPNIWVQLTGSAAHVELVVCRVPDTGRYTIKPSTMALLSTATDTPWQIAIGRNSDAVVTTQSAAVTVVVESNIYGPVTIAQ